MPQKDLEREKAITEQCLKQNYLMLKQLYIYLLSKSTSYPLVSLETMHNYFLTKLAPVSLWNPVVLKAKTS